MCVDRLGKDQKISGAHQGSDDQEKATATTKLEAIVDIGVESGKGKFGGYRSGSMNLKL